MICKTTRSRSIKAALTKACALVLLLLSVSHRGLADPQQLNLAGGRAWLNVSRPLTELDLKGRVVLLDFWTFCCINCMHVIPDLKYLEDKFGDRLTVIGVHSAKFSNEQASENIRNAILRYEVHHPVVNDADFTIWNRYGVNAWPTFLLFNTDGQLSLRLSGEGQRQRLEQSIAALLEKSPQAELIALPLKTEVASSNILKFPGKLLSDDANDRLFISNSSAHSILEVNANAEVVNQIGSAIAGFKDGSFTEAQFARPQGLALRDNILYVADTENDAIRAVNLSNRKVSTLIAHGISSPWDLVVDNDRLLVAMAGSHQIWEVDRINGEAKVLIGSGREDLIDGDFSQAALAQPSGLALVGKKLYIADSEVSAVREADLDTKKLRTLVGAGLFEFGDKDGDFATARLQHPLGVAFLDGKLIVADSYNHKLRQIDLENRTITSIIGSANIDQLSEPGGLSVSKHGIYVADTNNHRVRLLENNGQLKTLTISRAAALRDLIAQELPNLQKITHPPIALREGAPLNLRINFDLPAGYHINQEAPSQATIWRGDSKKANLVVRDRSLEVPISQQSGDLHILATIYFCPIADGTTCEIKSFDFSASFRSDEHAPPNVAINLELSASAQ